MWPGMQGTGAAAVTCGCCYMAIAIAVTRLPMAAGVFLPLPFKLALRAVALVASL